MTDKVIKAIEAIALFQALGSWVENDAYTPEPGDYIFYDWQDSGVGDNTGGTARG